MHLWKGEMLSRVATVWSRWAGAMARAGNEARELRWAYGRGPSTLGLDTGEIIGGFKTVPARNGEL